MFESGLKTQEMVLNDSADGREEWRRVNSDTVGVSFEFQREASAGTSAKLWMLGGFDFIHLKAVNLSLVPNPSALESYVFLKLVKSGTMLVESRAGEQTFHAGSLVLTDPTSRYVQRFDGRTELLALRFPKRLLVERGFKSSMRVPCVPNTETPDARAIGDLLLAIASQSGSTSLALRERQGAHILDLMGVVAGDPLAIGNPRKFDGTLYRAKSYIAQHLHDVNLDGKHIASALNVSNASLHRAFSAADTSLMRHVWSCRLERAADLLVRQRKVSVRISEIAYRCGFQNAAHFSRTFKARFGMSPREAAAYGMPERQCPSGFSVKG
jgi:AraC-like DNA-binding protein